MVLPLISGLIVATQDDDADTTPVMPLDTTPPSLVSAGYEGASLTGPTPCPATDGTQDRVTSFETPPPVCLDPASAYALELNTLSGAIAVALNPEVSPAATNLVVALARFGVYESAPMTVYDGLVLLGGAGDAGFTIDADPAPANAGYPVGSVVALADIEGSLAGQIAIVTGELGGQALAADPVHPVIGVVDDGLDVLDAIFELALANPMTPYRLRTATVTQIPD